MNETFVAPTGGGSATISAALMAALSGHPERRGVFGRWPNGCHFVRVFDSPADPAWGRAELCGTQDGWAWRADLDALATPVSGE